MEHHHGSGLVEGNPWTLVGMSWIVILTLAIISYLGMRNRGKIPGPLQSILEFAVSGMFNFIEGIIGHDGRKYAPFITTLFFYILFLNLLGIIPGLRSPTSALNMTIALALCSFFYVQFQAIRQNGPVKYVKHFWGDPWWLGFLMFPIHIIGELAKPLSLSIRLFGNIFGEDKIIVILAAMSPYIIKPWLKLLPIQFPMMAFGVFTSFIQALIFTVLTAGYLTVLISHAEEATTLAEQH
ncbi:MAG: F0F1 ATP synthase subunit A [Armatimonadota bacterium]|nr:F0F1 ATP synthase subunit A [Armatimonadota bacterium]